MRVRLLQSAALTACLATAACGSSGGGGVSSTPTPIAAPAPTPTPTPVATPTPTPTVAAVPSSNDTSEYRSTVGAVSMNALTAYDHGATGAGIKVGVVDTGLDMASDQFTGRVDPASRNVAGGASYDDQDGHGTAVAFTIAGVRNGSGTQGVAFGATIIAARADTPGSCAAGGASASGDSCTFDDANIAAGVDLAVSNGARIVNISLGGDAPSSALLAALNRATARGVIIVVSAGNNGKDAVKGASPDAFGAGLADSPYARNLVLIAGSVSANPTRLPSGDTISDFSNRAGTGPAADHYIAAVGENVRAPCNDTAVCLWSGTSFSAPQIAGAAALLAQAFPNLTGAQIVQILLTTTRDAGAPGTDSVYGRGVLDLTRAFQPAGGITTTTGASVSMAANGTLSAAMGDAKVGTLGAIILDGYDRAFAMDLARTLARTTPQHDLTAALTGRQQNVAFDRGGTSVAMTIAPIRNAGQSAAALTAFGLSRADAEQSRAIAGSVIQRLGDKSSFAIGFAESGQGLTARLSGQSAPAFLVAREPGAGLGFDSRARGSVAVRRQLGGWGVTGAVESGDVLVRGDREVQAALAYRYDRSGYQRAAVTIDRRFGALGLWLGGSRLAERDTMLGARLGAGLGSPRATSWFVDATARLDAGSGWSIGGSLRRGWTIADVRSGLTGAGSLRSAAFSADVAKSGVFTKGDGLSLRIAQPLRVTGGGLSLLLPTGWSYTDGRVSDYTAQFLNLTPTGHELDVEAAYGIAVGRGALQTNLFYRRDPGNFASIPADYGMALRYGFSF
ncbi:S8 family peptidase [Sphingomonas sp.]|uniref:S8 family peptidase n=1 Tax=Sphingomonas sp. TaxID=28214 RepID=UPI002600BC6D|nr:S8 family peptidase [Sphingomonas sp.]